MCFGQLYSFDESNAPPSQQEADLRHKVAVMTACVNGEAIEYRARNVGLFWYPCLSPTWDWTKYDYRVAPATVDPNVIIIPQHALSTLRSSFNFNRRDARDWPPHVRASHLTLAIKAFLNEVDGKEP